MSNRPEDGEAANAASVTRPPLRIPKTRPTRLGQVHPTATTIVIIIAVFVLFKSMLPATKTPTVTLPGGFIDIKMLALLGWAGLVVCARLLGLFSFRLHPASRRYWLWPMLALAVFELLSVPFNGRTSEERFYSLLECAQLAAPVLISVLMVSGLPYRQRLRVGVGVVVTLSFVVLAYMGLSFLFPGFRPSSSYVDRVTLSLGFIRVFGPLGNAASLAIVLFPALGFATGMLFVPGRSRLFWGMISFIMFAAILGTGSRGAVLCIPAFGILLLGLRLTKALLLVVPIGVLVLILVVAVGVPERMRQLEDKTRVESYRTAWTAFTSSPTSMIVGVGHGHLYMPTYANTMRRVYTRNRWHMLTLHTEFGTVLHGAHSTPMKVLPESGLVGAALLVVPLLWVIWSAFGFRIRKLRDPYTLQARFTLAGCITGMILMLVNTFFFSQPWLGLIWITLMLIASETVAEAAPPRQILGQRVRGRRGLESASRRPSRRGVMVSGFLATLLLTLGAEEAPAQPAAPVQPTADVAGNPEAVKRVSDGLETQANAAWWGYDPVDATEAIQSAINSGAKTVTIPNVGRPWLVRPIHLASDQTIVLERGVVILAKKNAFRGIHDCLLMGIDIKNVEIRGYGAVLRMRKADYTGPPYLTSEFRHTLSLEGASHVKILGLTLEASGGDGIYLGPTRDDRRVPCRNIEIRDCVCDGNYRQGISVISAEGLLIEKCVFRNTDGTRPKAGIDLEPANARDVLQDVVIRHCESEANRGAGLLVNLARINASSRPVSVLFDKCIVRSSYGPSIRAYVGTGSRGEVEFRDCECYDTTYPGLFAEWEKPSSATLRFVRCRWERVARRKTHRPLSLTVAAGAGRVVFESCLVIDERPRPFIRVSDKSTIGSASNVSGDIELNAPHATQLAPREALAIKRLQVTRQSATTP